MLETPQQRGAYIELMRDLKSPSGLAAVAEVRAYYCVNCWEHFCSPVTDSPGHICGTLTWSGQRLRQLRQKESLL